MSSLDDCKCIAMRREKGQKDKRKQSSPSISFHEADIIICFLLPFISASFTFHWHHISYESFILLLLIFILHFYIPSNRFTSASLLLSTANRYRFACNEFFSMLMCSLFPHLHLHEIHSILWVLGE